jgi:8-oxo-dGTP diphosphatase
MKDNKKNERYKKINFCVQCGNKLIIKPDRENKDRPHCLECGWIYYKNPIPAVACVVKNEQGELLLVKRKFEPKPNMWALPSGYIEIWQDPKDAAVEELFEETGLKGIIIHFIDYYSGSSPIYEKILSIGFRLDIIGGELQAGDDALEAKFFKLDELPEIAFWSHRHFIKLENIKDDTPIKRKK